MEITNYEISKKLKEAGFDAETDFYWYCYGVRRTRFCIDFYLGFECYRVSFMA